MTCSVGDATDSSVGGVCSSDGFEAASFDGGLLSRGERWRREAASPARRWAWIYVEEERHASE
jgi:hypothetical protein